MLFHDYEKNPRFLDILLHNFISMNIWYVYLYNPNILQFPGMSFQTANHDAGEVGVVEWPQCGWVSWIQLEIRNMTCWLMGRNMFILRPKKKQWFTKIDKRISTDGSPPSGSNKLIFTACKATGGATLDWHFHGYQHFPSHYNLQWVWPLDNHLL